MNARALTLLIGLLWLGTASAAALPDPSVIENAVETTTKATGIPTAVGAIAARGCTRCAERFLTLTADSKFFVGRTQVPFAEFQALAGGTRSRFMTIFYRRDNTVTRVVVAAD